MSGEGGSGWADLVVRDGDEVSTDGTLLRSREGWFVVPDGARVVTAHGEVTHVMPRVDVLLPDADPGPDPGPDIGAAAALHRRRVRVVGTWGRSASACPFRRARPDGRRSAGPDPRRTDVADAGPALRAAGDVRNPAHRLRPEPAAAAPAASGAAVAGRTRPGRRGHSAPAGPHRDRVRCGASGGGGPGRRGGLRRPGRVGRPVRPGPGRRHLPLEQRHRARPAAGGRPGGRGGGGDQQCRSERLPRATASLLYLPAALAQRLVAYPHDALDLTVFVVPAAAPARTPPVG